MLKKLSLFLGALIIVTSLSACGDNETSNNITDSDQSNSEASDIDNTSGEETSTVKVGFIFNGKLSESTYNTHINTARLSLNSSNVETEYIEDVNLQDLEQAVQKLVDDKCNVIVSTSNKYAKSLISLATKHKDVKFISNGGGVAQTNLTQYKAKIYQGAYLAGVISAMNTQSDKIAIVVESNMFNSKPFFNAVALGSQLIVDDIEVKIYYADTVDESQQAVDKAIADKNDVIITYQNTANAYRYAKTKSVKLIGAEIHPEELDKDKTLYSFYTKWDDYFKNQINSIVEGKWKPEDYYGGLNQGNVIAGQLSENAKKGTAEVLKEIETFVRSGQAQIFQGQIKDNRGTIVVYKNVIMKPQEIDGMSWVAAGITASENFTKVKTDIGGSDFVIKK